MANDLENQLKRSLARVPPPDGFAERVMERLPAPKQRFPYGRWWLSVAATVVLTFSLLIYRQHQDREHKQAQKKQEQLVFALRLTAKKLMIVESTLKKSTRSLRTTKEEL